MKRYSKRKKLIAIALFFVLIVVSGVGLAATGNFENPLSLLTTNGQRVEGSGGRPQQVGNSTSTSGTTMVAQRPQGGDQEQSVSWSAFGSVLYNIWYLFAITGVVMLVAPAVGFVVKQIRQHLPRSQRTKVALSA